MVSLMRLLIIILIVTPLFFIPPWYLGTRFGHGPWGMAPFMLLSLLTFLFPLLRGKKLVKISYLAMGLFSFLFVLFVARDFIKMITGYSFSADLTALLSSVVLTMIGLWWGRKPKLKKVVFEIPELPEKLKGMTIVQISDLHVRTNISAKYIGRVTKLTNELNPDLIALTGDIGDSEHSVHAKEMDSFKNLKPKLGMFYVPGNHEYYWDVNAWTDVMKNLGAIPLFNIGKETHLNGEDIFVSGITDTMDRKNPPDLILAKAGEEKAALRILLAHRPDPVKAASHLGFHLQLSGHTHGGQFFPWTLAVRFVNKHHLGLFTEGKMKIYVSGGTGSWGPLLRLGSTAELTHITFK
jgi:hypothetical protein